MDGVILYAEVGKDASIYQGPLHIFYNARLA